MLSFADLLGVLAAKASSNTISVACEFKYFFDSFSLNDLRTLSHNLSADNESMPSHATIMNSSLSLFRSIHVIVGSAIIALG